jgi:cellobiose phosphorylase
MDPYGTFIFVQNLNAGNVWTTTSKPFNHTGDNYKVTCFPNTVKYSRKDGNILTQMEVFVAPDDPVEIRKVSLTNSSQYTGISS